MRISRWVIAIGSFCALSSSMLRAQGASVEASVEFVRPGNQKAASHKSPATAIVWLSGASAETKISSATPASGVFRMEQKNKGFNPHLLVVPLGSTVEFPNLDPFFHNVFSQFNGKRFDLGLYEAGSTRGVRFDHEGVSYIFCNIHSQMAAVIVTLATPYYAVAKQTGLVRMSDIPPGDYDFHVWAEGVDTKRSNALTRRIHVGSAPVELGTVEIDVPETPPNHKNKFGEDYNPEPATTYP